MRPRKKDRHLPPCVYHKHGAYWLVKGGKWENLGADLPAALEAYGKTFNRPAGLMPALIDAALKEHRQHIAKNTQDQYDVVGKKLKHIFQDADPAQVTSRDVVRVRMALAATPNMANRCLSVLSLVFNYALEMQLVDRNPVVGVERLGEPHRERLLAHKEFQAIKAEAPARLAVVMDLLYLTGQRVNDVLRIQTKDLTESGIYFRQQKTGKRLLVRWTSELRAVVEQAKTLHGNVRALTLLHGRAGKAPNYRSTRDQWDAACERAGVGDAQLRDIRAMSLTDAEDQGMNPTALAGHSSEQMTKRYLRAKKVKEVSGPSFRQVSKKDTLSS
jgi:integrase